MVVEDGDGDADAVVGLSVQQQTVCHFCVFFVFVSSSSLSRSRNSPEWERKPQQKHPGPHR